jgi:hypothetical protein
MASRHSGYPRDKNDFYLEPDWCVEQMLDAVSFDGAIHDPCCGIGTIVSAAQRRGIAATGADLIDRAEGRFPVVDFFADTAVRENIVSNPPFHRGKLEQVLEHALRHVVPGGRIALLTAMQFLNSQGRYHLFDPRQCERVLIHARRPSMPPGELIEFFGESERHSGSTDYCWTVFQPGRDPIAPVEIGWLAP